MVDAGPHNLDQAMNSRRLDLDLTWKQVAERAGMTEFHLQRIRSGKVSLTDRAASKIDRALEWESGSARKCLEGHSPTPLRKEHSPPPDDVEVMLHELGIDARKWRRVPQSTRDAVTTAYRIDRERRTKEAQRADGA